MLFNLTPKLSSKSITWRYGAPVAVAIFALAVPSRLTAQRTKDVPLRDLTPPEAVSSDPFGKIVNVRELIDGTLLVNDGARRQVIALDAALRNRVVVLDSFTTRAGYGRYPSSLIPYKADSLLLIGRSGITVIDPSGRVIDWTPATQQIAITSISGPTIGADRDGYIIFMPSLGSRPPAAGEPSSTRAMSPTGTVTSGAPSSGLPPNTSVIVRGDFKTRQIKRIATFRMEPSARISMETAPNGQRVARTVLQPLATWDDYAILSDGTVAVVRTGDYHVEFYRANGTVDTAAALPFDWKRLSDADRKAIIDSTRDAQLKAEAAGVMTMERQGAGVMAGVAVANATGVNTGKIGDGFSVKVVRADSVAAGVVAGYSGTGATPPPVNALPFGMKAADLEYVPYTDLPTSYPPFRLDALNVDLKDNLWIRTTTKDPSGAGGAMYDVVNDRGVLVERVRVPAGKYVAGFGRDGSVYLRYEVAKNWAVERTRVAR